MGKVEFNDEIVRMRKLVKQVRVCVIRKLTRKAKTLRTEKGNEKQLDKNKKKADKLINEILYLKKIKDDNITKFGISNKKSLQEILQNKKSKVNTRIMARIVDHKLLKNVIIQLRNKYPDYEQYLQPGKNKSTTKQDNKFEEKDKSEIKEKKKILNDSKVIEGSIENELNSDYEDSDVEIKMEDNDDNKSDIEDNNVETKTEDNKFFEREQSSEDEEPYLESRNILKVESTTPEKIKVESTTSEKIKVESTTSEKIKVESTTPEKIKVEPTTPEKIKVELTTPEKIENKDSKKDLKRDRRKMIESIKEFDTDDDHKNIKKARTKKISKIDKDKETVKVINKQATVKRFVDIIKEEEHSEENDYSKVNGKTKSSIKNKSKSEKIVDPFFISEDGDAYLSLAPLNMIGNNNSSLDEDDYGNNNKSIRHNNKRTFANDRFFNNIKSEDITGRRRREESRHNDNHFNRDTNLFKKNKKNNSEPSSSFRDAKKNRSKNVTVNANSNENENLHPSWAAKKRQQEIISQSIQQGVKANKIIFDE